MAVRCRAGIAQSVKHSSGCLISYCELRHDKSPPMPICGSGGMRLGWGGAKGVMPRGNVKISLPEETSPKVQHRGTSGNTKRTCVLQKLNENDLKVPWQSFWTSHRHNHPATYSEYTQAGGMSTLKGVTDLIFDKIFLKTTWK